MLADVVGVAVGIFFIYLLLSLLISTFVEWLSRKLGWRGQVLRRWLEQLLDGSKGTNLSVRLYEHPLIKPLAGEGKEGLPPTIPPRWFAIALIDTLRKPEAEFPSSVDELRQVIERSQDCPDSTRRALIGIVSQASPDLKGALDDISSWFDEVMQSLRLAYKSMVQQRIFIVALIVAALLNIDTIGICDVLWSDSQVRHKVRAAAEEFLARVETLGPEEVSSEALTAARMILKMSELRLPILWSRDRDDPRHFPATPSGWLLKILGLGATALATSLGAPFWFDLLRKVIGASKLRASSAM